jgi:hypothetical protein
MPRSKGFEIMRMIRRRHCILCRFMVDLQLRPGRATPRQVNATEPQKPPTALGGNRFRHLEAIAHANERT